MKENIFESIENHLVNDEKPSIYLNEIRSEFKDTPLEIMFKLKGTMQNPEFHPEGDVWNHTLEVVDIAAKLREFANNKEAFMLATFFHDIGKITTTKKNKQGRWISYNHDTEGEKIIREILDNYDINENKKEIIINLAKYHMHHIYINKDLPFGKPEAMIKTVDMNDMLLMFLSDKLGRGQKEKDKKMKEIEEVKSILEKLKNNNQLNFPKESEFFEKIIKKL